MASRRAQLTIAVTSALLVAAGAVWSCAPFASEASPTGDAGSADATSPAPGDGAAHAETGTTSSPDASRCGVADASFCDGFDVQPFNTVWPGSTGGIELDTTDFTSPPRSLVVPVSAAQAGARYTFRRLSQRDLAFAPRFHFEARLKTGGGGAGDIDVLSARVLDAPNLGGDYQLTLVREGASWSIWETCGASDGRRIDALPLAEGRWQRFELEVQLDSRNAEARVDGAAVPFTLECPPTGGEFALTAGASSISGPDGTFTIRVDDVRFWTL